MILISDNVFIIGRDVEKTVSGMNYYSYRFMIRPQEDNFIMRCDKLFHKYAVDMYAKIEAKRLNFLGVN